MFIFIGFWIALSAHLWLPAIDGKMDADAQYKVQEAGTQKILLERVRR